MFIADDSPLRIPPVDLSREQILVFDGIRYAAEVAALAYERLFNQLQALAGEHAPRATNRDIAAAMLDAWSVIDSVHRMRDLIEHAPGVPNQPWKRLFRERTQIAEDLRHAVQHLSNEIRSLAESAGQVWGWLSWAEVRDGKHTGKWVVMSPGAVHRGDSWLFVGPNVANPPLPLGRVRLNAFGRQVYLGLLLSAVSGATAELTRQIAGGHVRPRGDTPSARVDGDMILESWVIVAYANTTAPNP